MCVHGTGSFVDLVIGPMPRAEPRPLRRCTHPNVGWRRHNRSVFTIETFTATTGSALDWVCDTLGWFELVQEDQRARRRRSTGANGVMFVPALTGHPDARHGAQGHGLAHRLLHVDDLAEDGLRRAGGHRPLCRHQRGGRRGGRRHRRSPRSSSAGACRPAIRSFRCRPTSIGVPMRRLPGIGGGEPARSRLPGGQRTVCSGTRCEEAAAVHGRGRNLRAHASPRRRIDRRAKWAARIAVELEMARV